MTAYRCVCRAAAFNQQAEKPRVKIHACVCVRARVLSFISGDSAMWGTPLCSTNSPHICVKHSCKGDTSAHERSLLVAVKGTTVCPCLYPKTVHLDPASLTRPRSFIYHTLLTSHLQLQRVLLFFPSFFEWMLHPPGHFFFSSLTSFVITLSSCPLQSPSVLLCRCHTPSVLCSL